MSKWIGLVLVGLVLAGPAFGQVINTVGYVRTGSAPVHVPSAQGATVAIDTLSGDWYEWDKAANIWRAAGFRIQQTNTTGVPNYTPAKQRSRLAVNAGDSLFVFQAGTWGLIRAVAPEAATQAEVDAGVDSTKWVSPATFEGAAKWNTKVSSVTGPSVNNSDPLNPVVEIPSNLTFYSTTTPSDVAGYSQLVIDINDPAYNDPAVDVSTGAITGLAQPVGVLISPAGTFAGNPGVISISTVGEIRRVSGTGLAEFYYEVYQRDSNGVETLVATSNATAPVSQSVYTQFSASALLLNGNWVASDRVVIRYYANRIAGGSDPSYQFSFGGTNPVRTLFPISASLLLNVPISVGVTGVTGGVPGSVLTVDALGKLGQATLPIDTVTLLVQDSVVAYFVAGNEVGRDTVRVAAGGAGTVKGLGTTNYLARWAASDSLGIGTVIDSAGFVGVGATTFAAQDRLKVERNYNGSTRLLVQNSNNGTAAGSDMTLISDGGRRLEFKLFSSGFTSSGLNQPNTGQLLFANGGTFHIGNSSTTGNLTFFSGGVGNANRRLIIQPTGEIGVGINTPSARFQVRGAGTTTATTNFLFENSAGTLIAQGNDAGEVGIGVAPVAGTRLVVQGTGSTSASNALTARNSTGINTFQLRDNGTALLGTNQTFTATGQHSDLEISNTYTNSIVTVNQAVGALNLSSFYDGTLAYGNGRQISAISTLRNTATGNNLRAAYFSARTASAARGLNIISFTAQPIMGSSGNIGNLIGAEISLIKENSGILTNAYGVHVANLSNSGGTITNTYGIYIGDITAGTQTNTPYAIYSEDTGARSFHAGQFGIGTATPDASAALHVASTTQGFLPPRMTTAQRDAIASPAAGLMVYDTTVNKVSVWNGTEWKYVAFE